MCTAHREIFTAYDEEESVKRKVFFTDLDGTLLNDERQIPQENQIAVDQALAAGHSIVITTGRPLTSTLIQVEKLGLTREGCYAVTFNGAQIYDCGRKKTIFGRGVPKELVFPIFARARELGIQIQTFTDSDVVSETETPALHRYADRTLQTFRIVSDIRTALCRDPYKILAIEEERRPVIEKLQQEILSQYGGMLDCFFSNDAYLEIVAAGTSKGRALRWMCDFLGLSVEDSVSAGDAANDVGMIEAAHVGAAMANSFPGVKEHADYVTEADNNHGGVAEVIHKFILEDS